MDFNFCCNLTAFVSLKRKLLHRELNSQHCKYYLSLPSLPAAGIPVVRQGAFLTITALKEDAKTEDDCIYKKVYGRRDTSYLPKGKKYLNCLLGQYQG